jgi:3-hydroxyacyl-[acyl-carrier-protein] dehydratase
MHDIYSLIPHREPFFFVDRVVSTTDTGVVAELFVDPEWACFRGHYPGNPIMPGVLLCESVFQTAACFLSKKLGAEARDGKTPVLSRIQDAKFKQIVRPGDTLRIQAELVEILQTFYFMKGSIRNQQEKLVLSIQFALTLAQTP